MVDAAAGIQIMGFISEWAGEGADRKSISGDYIMCVVEGAYSHDAGKLKERNGVGYNEVGSEKRGRNRVNEKGRD